MRKPTFSAQAIQIRARILVTVMRLAQECGHVPGATVCSERSKAEGEDCRCRQTDVGEQRHHDTVASRHIRDGEQQAGGPGLGQRMPEDVRDDGDVPEHHAEQHEVDTGGVGHRQGPAHQRDGGRADDDVAAEHGNGRLLPAWRF